MEKFNITVENKLYRISQMQVGKRPVFRALINGEAVFFEREGEACHPVPGSSGDPELLNKIARGIDSYLW